MANTLTNLIPVMYQGLDIVARELVGFIPAVSKDVKADSAAVGQTIRTPVIPAATTGDIAPGQLPPDDGDQTISYIDMQISKSKYSPIRWAGEEVMGFKNNGTFADTLAKQFAQSIRALVNLAENDLAVTAYQGASRAYGTAGTTPFGTAGDLSDFAGVRRILEDNGIHNDLNLILNSAAAQNLRGKQSVLFKVSEAGSDKLLRTGAFEQVEGFNLGISNGLKGQITKGTGSAYVTSGATAAGVSSIALVTGSGTVLAGDIVAFAADTANKYVVGSGVSAPGTISLNTPGAQIVIPTGNAMTIGNNFTPNVAFNSDCIKLMTRTPAMPEGGDSADDVYVITDPVSGLSFQVALYRTYRRVKYEVGLAWGTKAVKSDGIAILLG